MDYVRDQFEGIVSGVAGLIASLVCAAMFTPLAAADTTRASRASWLGGAKALSSIGWSPAPCARPASLIAPAPG